MAKSPNKIYSGSAYSKQKKYGSVAQFSGSGGDAQGIMSMVGSMGGGGGDKKEEKKGELVYNYRTGKTETTPSAFKLRSGNTSSFKMLGSSPAKFFGSIGRVNASSVFSGGISGWVDKIRAKREAMRNKRLGITPTAPGGGGGDGAHTHGTGGEPIGAGAQAVTAQAAAPVEPGVEEEEVV